MVLRGAGKDPDHGAAVLGVGIPGPTSQPGRNQPIAVATKNTVVGSFDSVRLRHDTGRNNVEIVETRLASCVDSGVAEDIFEAHVIRRPTDSGSYDITNAQRICDSIKMGHTLLYAGEDHEIRCDSEYSLTDRDLLGE